jgi:hypothetical protein
MPVMPALFSTSKLYIFLSFTLIGAKVFADLMHEQQQQGVQQLEGQSPQLS